MRPLLGRFCGVQDLNDRCCTNCSGRVFLNYFSSFFWICSLNLQIISRPIRRNLKELNSRIFLIFGSVQLVHLALAVSILTFYSHHYCCCFALFAWVITQNHGSDGVRRIRNHHIFLVKSSHLFNRLCCCLRNLYLFVRKDEKIIFLQTCFLNLHRVICISFRFHY